jgi:hypothetical protein
LIDRGDRFVQSNVVGFCSPGHVLCIEDVIHAFMCTRIIPAVALATTLISPAIAGAETNLLLAPMCTADLTVPITIYNQSHLSDDDIDAIFRTANDLWQPYGVTLVPASSRGVAVIVADGWSSDSQGDASSMVLGTTLFTNGHADPYIHLWVGAAQALLDTVTRPSSNTSDVERTASLRPVLGVAFAHELGHYLLDTPRHAGGLLQPFPSVYDLQHPTIAHLGLTTQQQSKLCLAHPPSFRNDPVIPDVNGTARTVSLTSAGRARARLMLPRDAGDVCGRHHGSSSLVYRRNAHDTVGVRHRGSRHGRVLGVASVPDVGRVGDCRVRCRLAIAAAS